MVIKTLHWYIFRELLRIFVMTASALTTLMAFGGVFKPFAKQGVEIVQLMTIMMNLMPAMLAYAIPIAALFAAVLVYWRLSTDNELTACRASGISFVTMMIPAFLLGLAMAVVDMGFVHYVVPVFLQRTERAVLSDLGNLVVSQITREENIRWGPYSVRADAATEQPSTDKDVVILMLDGMAGTKMKDKKPTQIVMARHAIATITSTPDSENEAVVTVKLIEASAFNSETFDRYSGSIDSLEGGQAFPIASTLKSKPKFLNVRKLYEYRVDPTGFQPVKEVLDKIAVFMRYATISGRLHDAWRENIARGFVPYRTPGHIEGTVDQLELRAPFAYLNPERQLVYMSPAAKDGAPVRQVELKQFRVTPRGRKLIYTYNCTEATVTMGPDQLSSKSLAVALKLKNVTSRDIERDIPGYTGLEKDIPVVLDPAVGEVTLPPPADLLAAARSDNAAPSMKQRAAEADGQISKLRNSIKSELHSRASFSVSCFTLVLFGAALGILLRGKNPLAVFVLGFVPAVFLVLLITAGRQMAESENSKNVPIGITLIWMGNAVLLVLIASVYTKLLRH